MRQGPKWIPGEVSDKRGPVSYDVKMNGQLLRRHTEQLLSRVNASPSDSEPTGEVGDDPVPISALELNTEN